MQRNGFELAVRQASQTVDQPQTWSLIKKMKPEQTQNMFMRKSLGLEHVYQHLFSSCLNW